MDKKDLNQIRMVLKEEIKPVFDLLETIIYDFSTLKFEARQNHEEMSDQFRHLSYSLENDLGPLQEEIKDLKIRATKLERPT